MKLSKVGDLLANREKRLVIVVALLAIGGAIGLREGWRTLGVTLFAAALALVAAWVLLVFRPARIPRDGLLRFTLAGALREFWPRSAVDRILGRGFPTLYHLRLALEAAAEDRSLRAVMVEIAHLEIGLGTAQELHDLLAAVRASGRRVIALLRGDSVGVREYLVAAGAGEIVANPELAMMMLGVAAGAVFLKRALDQIDIQAQTLQWKEYKGAAEIFGREEMSPALRESLEAIVSDWQRTLVDCVARDRKIEPERARQLLNGGFLSARAGVEAGLVDRIGYAEDVVAEFDPEGKGKKIVDLGRYFRHVVYERGTARRPRIALVHGTGPVIAGAGPGAGEFLSGEDTADLIDGAARDDRVRAIVFRVNSPGGSAVGSDLVWRAVQEARGRGKPVVVSMGDVAGSGGYYVAMGADAIVAEPATVTGSIGVFYTKFNLGRLMAKLGIRLDYAKSGDVSDALSPARALNEMELAQLDRTVGEMYGNFTAKVAQGRKLSPERTEELARGRVWSGLAAREHGLVDEIGGVSRAVELAREKAGLRPDEPHDLVPYHPLGRLAALKLSFRPVAETPWAAGLFSYALGVPEPWAPALLRLLSECRALFLCPLW